MGVTLPNHGAEQSRSESYGESWSSPGVPFIPLWPIQVRSFYFPNLAPNGDWFTPPERPFSKMFCSPAWVFLPEQRLRATLSLPLWVKLSKCKTVRCSCMFAGLSCTDVMSYHTCIQPLLLLFLSPLVSQFCCIPTCTNYCPKIYVYLSVREKLVPWFSV